MKKLAFIPLALLCLIAKSQVKVNLKVNAGYILDFLHIKKTPVESIEIGQYNGGDYFQAVYKGIVCYVAVDDIIPSVAYMRYAKKIIREQDNKNPFVQEYGRKWGNLIKYKIVAIGMSQDMVASAIGEPKTKTITRYDGITTQLWEYPNKWVYFNNGQVYSVTDF